MAAIRFIAGFDEQVEYFDTYCCRINMFFFVANSIADEKKVPTFLTLCWS